MGWLVRGRSAANGFTVGAPPVRVVSTAAAADSFTSLGGPGVLLPLLLPPERVTEMEAATTPRSVSTPRRGGSSSSSSSSARRPSAFPIRRSGSADSLDGLGGGGGGGGRSRAWRSSGEVRGLMARLNTAMAPPKLVLPPLQYAQVVSLIAAVIRMSPLCAHLSHRYSCKCPLRCVACCL